MVGDPRLLFSRYSGSLRNVPCAHSLQFYRERKCDDSHWIDIDMESDSF